MRQSRDPELLRWLAALGTETEYVYRCALLSLVPDFRADYDFKSATEALRVKLKLKETKLAAIRRAVAPRRPSSSILPIRHICSAHPALRRPSSMCS
jgi:hypothetical protein